MAVQLAECNIEVVSPPDIKYYAESGESPCQADLDMLRTCHAVYSNLHKLSAGAIVEMYVAKYEVRIPVVTWCRIPDPSPFIAFCTTIFAASHEQVIGELVRLKTGTVK